MAWMHPCIKCGACCAYFRVAFYWREAEPSENPKAVPKESTEDYSPFLLCMKGTNQKHHARCIELKGKVGEKVHCSIYERRPSPCRAFEASYESGSWNQRCDYARSKYNLPPLTPEDWIGSGQPHAVTQRKKPGKDYASPGSY